MIPRALRVGSLLDGAAARWAARVVTFAWAGCIFALSSVPGSSLPGRYGQLAHLLEYAMLGALLSASLRRSRGDGRAAALAVVIAACYALSDEFHQYFVPGRTVDAADWGTDVVGAALGALALLLPDGERAA